jgi:hypothetical protein
VPVVERACALLKKRHRSFANVEQRQRNACRVGRPNSASGNELGARNKNGPIARDLSTRHFGGIITSHWQGSSDGFSVLMVIHQWNARSS